MAMVGNWLTRYHYQKANISRTLSDNVFTVRIQTPNHEADLHVEAQLDSRPAPLPPGSVFSSVEEARKFAGPLPFTFSYDAAVNKMVVVKGVRKAWDPQPVTVRVHEASFLTRPPYAGVKATLSNAFYLEDVPYSWEAGKLEDI